MPEEEVVRVVTGAIEARNQTLQPGDVVVLGPTGAGAAQSLPPTTIVKTPALPGGVYDPRNPAFGYSPPRAGVNQPGVTPGTFTPVSPGDLARALSGEPPNLEPSIAPNGFPTTPGSVTPIVGPDGTLILAPPGTSGSTPPVIGPNGTPVLAPSGAPGATTPVIGPNGTPVFGPIRSAGVRPAPGRPERVSGDERSGRISPGRRARDVFS